MTNNMPTLTKNKPEPISRPIFESDDALITTLAADKKISWTDALHFLLSRTPEDNKNSDSQLMVEALDTLTEQINQLGVKVNSLTDTVENLNMLSVMDDGLKTDIIQALIMCKLWSDRETANKIKNAIEIIDGVEG